MNPNQTGNQPILYMDSLSAVSFALLPCLFRVECINVVYSFSAVLIEMRMNQQTPLKWCSQKPDDVYNALQRAMTLWATFCRRDTAIFF